MWKKLIYPRMNCNLFIGKSGKTYYVLSGWFKMELLPDIRVMNIIECVRNGASLNLACKINGCSPEDLSEQELHLIHFEEALYKQMMIEKLESTEDGRSRTRSLRKTLRGYEGALR